MIAETNTSVSQPKEDAHTMGRVTTPIIVENLKDLLDVRDGKMPAGQVRRIEVEKALVDTGASTLSLPTSMIRQLGLIKIKTRRAMTSRGLANSDIYAVARLTIQDRDCSLDVVEIPDGVPVLVGQIPLEMMDFVVDPVNQRIIGNPDHGGEQIVELL